MGNWCISLLEAKEATPKPSIFAEKLAPISNRNSQWSNESQVSLKLMIFFIVKVKVSCVQI